MLLIDVNVLVYAYREDSPDHPAYRNWLSKLLHSGAHFSVADLVLSGFLRITTHPKIFNPPSPLEDALRFAETLRGQPNCRTVAPGPRHWQIFTQLCQAAGAVGNAIPDAYLAAMAIETGSRWITTDGGFNRFPGLDWRHPLR
ncbi:MAG TPA: type II toxin-antitoxin system VapC family toxin [Thermoanaerobaculia bacterium]|nr:type II toxin-antitoxin system VapC family toxin [Thermoanaerobaculia bacterium]